jgi:hypothetical protein
MRGTGEGRHGRNRKADSGGREERQTDRKRGMCRQRRNRQADRVKEEEWSDRGGTEENTDRRGIEETDKGGKEEGKSRGKGRWEWKTGKNSGGRKR